MALVKYNDRSLRNLTTVPAAVTGNSPGALVHIKTLTASSSGTLSFVDGASSVVLDNTYPIYKFEFINIHTSATANFSFNGSDDDSSHSYDVVKTTTVFTAGHKEDGSASYVDYDTGQDEAQATDFQNLSYGIKTGNDESLSGYMYLFNPSSTTFVKHFIARTQYTDGDYSQNGHIAGYFNTTADITAIQFKMSTGNIDAGTIKLYGIKDA
jgi:hypothetical protein